MVDYREILWFASLGYSQRQIASSVRSSHNTVKAVLELAREHHKLADRGFSVTYCGLEQLFHSKRQRTRNGNCEPDYAHINKGSGTSRKH